MEETGGSELEAVKKYFDTAGFERWNKIYGETDEVNKVGGGWRDRGPQQLGETAHRHPSRSLAFQPGPGVLNVGISDKRALPRPPAPPPPAVCALLWCRCRWTSGTATPRRWTRSCAGWTRVSAAAAAAAIL